MTTPIRTTDMTSEWLVLQLLIDLGEDPDREGLKETPRRFVAMMKELTGGRHKHPLDDRLDVRLKDLFAAKFQEPSDEIIVVKKVEFTSLCEHHMAPFTGHAHIGYLPQTETGPVLGLSKFARVVDWFAGRLQVQERMTQQIADAIQTHLEPRGVGVIVEASHLCMKIRGVQKQDPVAVTSALRGVFKQACVKKEFMDLVFGRK